MTAIDTQPVDAPLNRAATFLVLTESQAPNAIDMIRDVISYVADMMKNVSIRHPSAMSCTVGIGSSIWDRLTAVPKPAELHPFQAVRGPKHTAISTPGDLLLHIRSERRDVSFEFERQLMNRLADSVKVEDETVGFRYLDARDFLGFVGDPPGKYDRILDFSRPLTGTTSFAPPASVLENLGDKGINR